MLALLCWRAQSIATAGGRWGRTDGPARSLDHRAPALGVVAVPLRREFEATSGFNRSPGVVAICLPCVGGPNGTDIHSNSH
jgi:hypothetical protein